jgi:hypothetical protein
MLVRDKFNVTCVCTNDSYAHKQITKLLLNISDCSLIPVNSNVRMLFQGLFSDQVSLTGALEENDTGWGVVPSQGVGDGW